MNKFVPAKELLDQAQRGGWAVPAFTVWDAQSAQAVLEVAEQKRSPVMLMAGSWEFPLLGIGPLAEVAATIARRATVPATLHADHVTSVEEIRACLEAGFSSVMFDGSLLPYPENVALTRRVVEMASPRGVSVEGELGALGRVSGPEQASAAQEFTDPDQAAQFVRETGISSLAVSIGNAHGIYRTAPRLDFERLARIRAVVRVPIVLHGGSSTPAADIRRAISLGVCKLNVASELAVAFRETISRISAREPGYWPAKALTEIEDECKQVVAGWIDLSGSGGRVAGGVTGNSSDGGAWRVPDKWAICQID